MINFSSLKELSILEGAVKKIVSAGVILWEIVKKYKNWVPFSTESDGKTIFNGIGYKEGCRLNSDAEVVELDGYVTFGYIPVKASDVIRVWGLTWDSDHNTGCYLHVFDSSFVKQKILRPTSGTADVEFSIGSIGELVFRIKSYASYCAYIRLSAYGPFGASVIITVNEEIVLQYINQVPFSIDPNGSVYNDGLGYKSGYRVRSGGAEAVLQRGSCTGYISAKGEDVVRVSGCDFNTEETANAINVYDESFTTLGQIVGNYAEAGYGIFAYGAAYQSTHNFNSVVEESPGIWRWTIPPESSIAYIRVTGATPDGSTLIVTINEEIV